MTAVLEKPLKTDTPPTAKGKARPRFKSLFTRGQRDAARKSEPAHLFQGRDIDKQYSAN